MKKIYRMFAAVSCISLLLSGCSQAVRMTEEEQNNVAEYMAYLILKHDKEYESKLQETLTVEQNPSIVQEDFAVLDPDGEKTPDDGKISDDGKPSGDSKPSDDDSDEKADYQDLNELLGKKNITVKFSGYDEYDTYPEEDTQGYFPPSAPEGMKLAVVKFEIKNLSDQELTFSQLNSDLKYRLDLDEKTFVKPRLTLLVNDLQYIDILLGPKETREAVVVFTVDKKAVLAGANLLVYSKTKTAIEKLK